MPYTRDEVEKAAVQVVGHLLTLHGFWAAYRKLFRGNEQSHPIMAQVASEFFWLLERSLKASFLQTLRQLTDGAMTAGRANASFYGLLQAIAGENYRAEHADMVAMIERVASPPSIRNHVNRYIAHFDLDLFVGRDAPPLPIDITDVDRALAAAREFMDTFMRRFFDEQPFDYTGKAELIPRQVDALIETLQRGIQAASDA